MYLAPTLDGVPASPNPDELTDIVAFIAAQQVHPDRRVSYLGTDAAGIIAELDALKPPWLSAARVLRDGTRITGAVITEWDDDLGRAWIVGPWVLGVGDAWMAAAVALLDAALAELPATVTRYEMCGDIANHRLADLAASQGWTASEPNHVLLADASVVAAWPGGDLQPAALRAAARDDIGTIAALHDAEFPDTYASATQLVDGQLDGSRVVLVADDGHGGVAGYAAGEVHDDGEGFIDFVAVDPASRGTGVWPAARRRHHPPAPRSIDARPGVPHGAGPSNAGPDPLRTTRLPARRIAHRLPLVDVVTTPLPSAVPR